MIIKSPLVIMSCNSVVYFASGKEEFYESSNILFLVYARVCPYDIETKERYLDLIHKVCTDKLLSDVTEY